MFLVINPGCNYGCAHVNEKVCDAMCKSGEILKEVSE